MYQNNRIVAILLMGGTGSRFGSDVPKQFHMLSGKKIYLHTVEVFQTVEEIDDIIIISHADWIETVKKELNNPSIRVVKGGLTRQESSYLGLMACTNADIVLIHDIVRPFVSQKVLLENIQKVHAYGAVDTCMASTDTLVCSKDQKTIDFIPKRSEMLRGQTPQSFRYDLIKKAHEFAIGSKNTQATDDCQLVLQYGHPLHVVISDEYNIKITSKLDLYIAEQILRMRKTILPKEDGSLEKKVFAIIGGSGGIGSELSNLLQQEKAEAIVLSPSSKDFPIDLMDPTSIETAFIAIEKTYGAIDGLINCAGFLKISPFRQLSIMEIEKLISINFTGLVHACRLVNLKKGGHIINIASSSYALGRQNYGLYSASKAAVVNFTQALSQEHKDLFINVIIPSRTNTKMRLKNFPDEDSSQLMHPHQVAVSIVSLLKQNSITGSIIEVKK